MDLYRLPVSYSVAYLESISRFLHLAMREESWRMSLGYFHSPNWKPSGEHMYPSNRFSPGWGMKVKDFIMRVRPKIVAIPALSGIMAPFLMVSLWAIASLLRPEYDQLTQYGSESGTGDNSAIMNTNFLITGILIVSCSLGLLASIRTGVWSRSGSIFVGLFGIAESATAAFSRDTGCPSTSQQSLS